MQDLIGLNGIFILAMNVICQKMIEIEMIVKLMKYGLIMEKYQKKISQVLSRFLDYR